jgi:hypothetical protein
MPWGVGGGGGGGNARTQVQRTQASTHARTHARTHAPLPLKWLLNRGPRAAPGLGTPLGELDQGHND